LGVLLHLKGLKGKKQEGGDRVREDRGRIGVPGGAGGHMRRKGKRGGYELLISRANTGVLGHLKKWQREPHGMRRPCCEWIPEPTYLGQQECKEKKKRNRGPPTFIRSV